MVRHALIPSPPSGAIQARIAGHESTRTTQLYNRLPDEVSLDEIERIHI